MPLDLPLCSGRVCSRCLPLSSWHPASSSTCVGRWFDHFLNEETKAQKGSSLPKLESLQELGSELQSPVCLGQVTHPL